MTTIEYLQYYMNSYRAPMRFLLFIIVILSLNQYLVAQEDDVNREMATSENFTWAMNLEKPDTNELKAMNGLVRGYRRIATDTFHILAKHAVDISEHLKEHYEHARSLVMFGLSHDLRNDFTTSIDLFEKAAEIYKLNGEEKSFASAKLAVGEVMISKGDYRDGIEEIIQATEMLKELKDTSNVIRANLGLGEAFRLLSQYSKAKEYQKIGLDLAQESHNKMMEMYALGEFGKTGRSLLDVFKNEIEKDTQDNGSLRDSITKTAEETIIYSKASYEMALKANKVYQQGYVLPFLMDAEQALGNFSSALAYGKQIEKLIPRIGYKEMEVVHHFDMAQIYHEMGNLPKAREYAERAHKEHTSEIDETYFAIQKMRSRIYKDLGNYKDAFFTAEEYYDFEIDRLDEENTKTINELETQYQTAQKEKEILEQRNNILELESANATLSKQRNYIIGGSILLAIMTFFGYQLKKTRRERNEKIAFAEALMFAQEEERKRIAHDLHDGIGQSLLLIKKNVETNQNISTDNQNMIAETLEEVRSLSRDLHPFQIEKYGLTDSIEEMLLKVEKSTNLFVSKEIMNIDDILADKHQIHIYRTIQEGLNNIIKHSDASAAKVIIEITTEQVLITILDNGKGFDYELAIARSKSLGLRTMYERVSSLGGSLSFSKNDPKGAKVEITIPIAKNS